MSISRKATPRRARSIAKVNPAAPAPQINTSVANPSGTGVLIVLRPTSPVCALPVKVRLLPDGASSRMYRLPDEVNSYDPSKYDMSLEQAGIQYPTVKIGAVMRLAW